MILKDIFDCPNKYKLKTRRDETNLSTYLYNKQTSKTKFFTLMHWMFAI